MGRYQPPAVTDQQIFGYRIDTVVHTAGVLDFLRPEGHQHGGAFCGKGTQSLDPAQTIGQHCVQSVLLLIPQNGEGTQLFQTDGNKGIRVSVQFLQRVSRMHKGHDGKNHALVTGGQIVKKFLGFRSGLIQFIGDSCGKIVLGVLPLLPPGNVRFNAQNLALHILDCFIRGDGEHINANHQTTGEVGQCGDHFIVHIAGIGLEEQHPANLAAHFKMVGLEADAVRADVVLEVYTPADGACHIKGKMLFLAGTEEVVEDPQAVMAANGSCTGIQPPKALSKIALHPAEVVTGRFDLPHRNGKGDVLFLHQVITFGGLAFHNAVGFSAVLVQLVAPLPHKDGVFKGYRIQLAVDNGDFRRRIGGQAVQHTTVGFEDAPLHFLGCRYVVHIGKPPSL